MKIDQLHPQLRKAYRWIPAIPFHSRIFLALVKLLSLIPRRTKPVPGVTIVEHKLGTARVRLYRPEGEHAGAALLWIHGGGYIIGSPAMNDKECARYAVELNIAVVSVGYRLAPGYRFPCAIDDCFEAWQWLQDNAGVLGVCRDRIAISGQSAGGGLAAALAQRVYDHGGVQPVGQALIYPMIDDRTAAHKTLDAVGHKLWSNRNNRGAWSHYLGRAPGASALPPYAAPARREDLAGLPPAWVGVGDIDLFYQENAVYAARLNEAGVSCELVVVPGAPHGFEVFAGDAPVSRDFMASNYRFLRRVLQL